MLVIDRGCQNSPTSCLIGYSWAGPGSSSWADAADPARAGFRIFFGFLLFRVYRVWENPGEPREARGSDSGTFRKSRSGPTSGQVRADLGPASREAVDAKKIRIQCADLVARTQALVARTQALVARTQALVARTLALVARTKALVARTLALLARTLALVARTHALVARTQALVAGHPSTLAGHPSTLAGHLSTLAGHPSTLGAFLGPMGP